MGKTNNSKRLGYMLIAFLLIVALGSAKALNSVQSTQQNRMLKQQYSYFTRLLENILYENNDTIECAYNDYGTVSTSGCKEFYTQLIQKLKIKRYCKNNALANQCIPLYKKYASDKNCEGYSKKMFNKHNDVVVLYNNVLIIIANDEKEQRYPMFAIDINGFNGPNEPGKDLFSFAITRRAGGNYLIDPDFTKCLPVEADDKKSDNKAS